MESIFVFLQGIFAALFLFLVGVFGFLLKNRFTEPSPVKGSKKPPIFSVGLPIFGNFVEFAKDPLGFIKSGKEHLGGVFTIDFVAEKCTFLIGAKYHKYFFEGSDEDLDQAAVYQFMTSVFGKGIVYDAPIEQRRQQMRALGACLKPSYLKMYSPIIAKEAYDYFRKHWGESGQVDLLPSLAELIILTASATLLGPEVRHELFLEVSKLYEMLDKGLTPLSIFFPGAPTSAHAKRDHARAEMAKLFARVIAKRRATDEATKVEESRSKHFDMLSKLMEFKYKDGTGLTEDQITGMLIAALFAGQHTSSVTTTWSVLFLLNDKLHGGKNFEKVMKEISSAEQATGNPGCFSRGLGPEASAIAQEPFLYSCIKEAIRLFPPLILLMRRVQTSFVTDDGFFIPKGHRVMVSNAIAQRLEEVFERPNEFHPDRWNDFDMSKLPKYSFIGFGAGIHTCMGESFAFMQIQTIISVLFAMYEMDLVTKFPNPDYAAIVVPPKGPNIVKYKLRTEADHNTLQNLFYTESKSESALKTSNFVPNLDTDFLESSEAAGPGFSIEEIAKHNKKDDAWLVVKGFVYDVSGYIHLHQGGDNSILRHAGKPDATTAVFGPQHPKTVSTLLERFKIGHVKY